MGYLEQSRQVLLIRLEAMLTGPGNHRGFDAGVYKYERITHTIQDYLDQIALAPGEEWKSHEVYHCGATRVQRTPNGRTALLARFDYPDLQADYPQWIHLGSMPWSKAYETSPAPDSQGGR